MIVGRLLDELLLWRAGRRIPAIRALAYVAVIFAIMAATDLREQWPGPGPMPSDGHAYTSFTLATTRAFCGLPAGLSTDANLGGLYLQRADLVDPPIRAVIASHWGSVERYCGLAAGTYFVNNENSLMLLEAWIMRVAPRISLGGLSRVMLALRLLMLAAFAFALLRAGASVLMAGLVTAAGITLLAALHHTFDYSLYAFLFCLVAGVIAFYSLAVERTSVRAAVIAALVAGVVTAFFANLRTSYLPLLAAFFAIYVAVAAWQMPKTARRLRAAAVMSVVFVAGYLTFQIVFIVRPSPTVRQGFSYHVIGHPLVLSLALPANPLAAREGIEWNDLTGERLAQRVDPTTVYMGPGYDRALLRYYLGLWAKYPREMVDVYLAKWRLAGWHAVVSAPFTTGVMNLLLEPWRHLASGFWYLGVFAATLVLSAWTYVRTRAPFLLLLSMSALAGIAMLVETAMINPYYVITYHQTLLFICALTTVAGAQLTLSGAAFAMAAAGSATLAWWRAPRPDRTLGERTIDDFGDQWTTYTTNDGYYGSPALLKDVFGPLVQLDELKGAVVADIGAGTGRFTNVFLASAVARVVAVEPSRAFEVLKRNTATEGHRVTYVNAPGDAFRSPEPIDFAFSYGVLHHIPDPRPTVAAMRDALKSGGRIGIWLYGREGNGLYVAAQRVLGWIATRLPHPLLAAMVWILYWPTMLYTAACRVLPLPLRRYFTEVYGKLTPDKRRLTLYDQLNPAYAKYYWQQEVRALLQDAGFVDIRLFHRHDYSWTAVAVKP